MIQTTRSKSGAKRPRAELVLASLHTVWSALTPSQPCRPQLFSLPGIPGSCHRGPVHTQGLLEKKNPKKTENVTTKHCHPNISQKGILSLY